MTPQTARILVVDDVPDWVATIGGLLSDEKYEVGVANSIVSAIQMLSNFNYNIAIIDIRLDETDDENTDGLTLARQVKERWPDTKVIVVTGYGTQPMVQQALSQNAAGIRIADSFIEKDRVQAIIPLVGQMLLKQ